MQLNILGRTYRVAIAGKPIVRDGEAKGGRSNHITRVIEISPDVLPDDRLESLVHEARHCFEELMRLEPAGDEEARCNRTAVDAAIFRQIEAQGGSSSLALLLAPDTFDRPAVSVGGATRNALDPQTCHRCHRTILDCSIVNGPVEETRLGPTLERWFECPSCSAVHVWRDACHADGSPAGLPLAGTSQVLTGRAAAAFLRQQQPEGELRLVPCD